MREGMRAGSMNRLGPPPYSREIQILAKLIRTFEVDNIQNHTYSNAKDNTFKVRPIKQNKHMYGAPVLVIFELSKVTLTSFCTP